MSGGKQRIIRGRGNAPITVKEKVLTDFEVANIVTGGNGFERNLLLAKVANGETFNGQYFFDKKKKSKESQDTEEEGED